MFGSTGNLGRALREEASARDWEFFGLARNPWYEWEIAVDASDWYALRDVIRDLPDLLDLVVFAQGVQRTVSLERFRPRNDWDIVTSNLDAAIFGTALLWQHRRLNKDALIVYCSSIQAIAPRPGRFLYAVTKAGLEALARSVTTETGSYVRGVALRLGQFENTMRGITFSEEERERIEKRVLRGLIPEAEIARFIFQLYETPHIAGCVIDFEGGHLLNIW